MLGTTNPTLSRLPNYYILGFKDSLKIYRLILVNAQIIPQFVRVIPNKIVCVSRKPYSPSSGNKILPLLGYNCVIHQHSLQIKYGLKGNAHYANIYIISNFYSIDRKHDMNALDEAIIMITYLLVGLCLCLFQHCHEYMHANGLILLLDKMKIVIENLSLHIACAAHD